MSYPELHQRGELERRAAAALELLAPCRLCPRRCLVDRTLDETGECQIGRQAHLCSLGPHFGEEEPLSGSKGSGTIFFGGCNLHCAFCQNAEISQAPSGQAQTAQQLAEAMLAVQQLGCHNLNLVSPTHVTAQILEALCLAAEQGLSLPLVYNCGGYESLATLALLDGVVDIYLPDLKYMDAEVGRRLSGVEDYPEVARQALQEMHRQVGDLELDQQGVARRGLLVRHLVLPEGLAGTAEAMQFLADELSPQTYVNVMDQYRPCHRIHGDPQLGRRLRAEELVQAMQQARRAGLTRFAR